MIVEKIYGYKPYIEEETKGKKFVHVKISVYSPTELEISVREFKKRETLVVIPFSEIELFKKAIDLVIKDQVAWNEHWEK